MSVSGSAINAFYYAWNTSTNSPVTGDGANHTLNVVADGSKSAIAGPSITDQGGGLYSVSLTGGKNTGTMMCIEGTSSTANVVLIGIAWNNSGGTTVNVTSQETSVISES